MVVSESVFPSAQCCHMTQKASWIPQALICELCMVPLVPKGAQRHAR